MDYVDAGTLLARAAVLGGIGLALMTIRPWDMWGLRTLPGPSRFPIVGNLLDIMQTPGGFAFWRCEMKKKFGKVYQVWLGSEPSVVVSDAGIVRKIMAATQQRPSLRIFVVLVGDLHYIGMQGLLSLSPEEHGPKFRAVRKAFETAAMSPASLKEQEPVVQECVARLLARLDRYAQRGEPLDMAVTLADMTMTIIGFISFGVDLHCLEPVTAGNHGDTGGKIQSKPPSNDWLSRPGTPEFGRGVTQAARTVIRLFDPALGSAWKLPGRFFPELFFLFRRLACALPDARMREEIQARNDFANAIRILIQQWKDHKAAGAVGGTTAALPAISGRGFLAKMLEVAEAEGLNELDVITQVWTMLLAGYETTASLLSAALVMLVEQPNLQARLQQEVDEVLKGKTPTSEDLDRLPYLKAVIDETLRLYPPADFSTRQPHRDITVGDGKVIPAGGYVWLSFRSVLRDADYWPRAEEFLPERWLPGNEHLVSNKDLAYMPFGGGARMCPGYKLALLEARLALAQMAQHFTFTAAAGCPKTKWTSGIVLSASCVWVHVQRRA